MQIENITTAGSITLEEVKNLSKYVKMTDEDVDNGLENYCYNPFLDDNDEDYIGKKDVIKQCRGLVFDKNGKMVMKAFSETPEYSSDETDVIYRLISLGGGQKDGESETDAINRGVNTCNFFKSREGVLLRMFNHNGRWFLSTHRKLNAFKSRWGSAESHGTIFKKALNNQMDSQDMDNSYDVLKQRLDPQKQYMFLTENNKNTRIVCQAPEVPKVYHVGSFVNGKLDMDDDIGLPKNEVVSVGNIDDIYTYVNEVDVFKSPGIIAFTNDGKQFKITNPKYSKLFALRGNQSSVKFRYLQVRNNNDDCTALRQLYPEFADDFDNYEDIIRKIAINIHTAYMKRFIQKEYVSVPPAEYNVIKMAHTWFKEDRDNRMVTRDVILDVIRFQTPSSINQMIKRILYPRVENDYKMKPRLDKNSGFTTADELATATAMVTDMVIE